MLAVCLALLLGLLAGCGGGDGGKGGTTAGDFIGCWEYEDYNSWLVVYEDGTYDWDWEGALTSGSYTIEEDELVLDEGYRFTLDGAGGLVDSDGDALFASRLPDDEDQSGSTVDFEDFIGCWEYDDADIGIWIDIREDWTYIWHWGTGSSSGEYQLEGEELVTDNGRRYTLDGMGGLVDDEGDTLFASRLPDDEDQSGGAAGIEDFIGCWEYEAYDLWLVVYENEAYDWISTTDSYSGTYAVEEGELVLDNGMRYTPDGAGGLTDQDGDALFASELSDSGSDGDESVDEDIFQSFVGYWGYDDYDVWAYIYDDGTCEWYSSNGTSISGSCWMEGEVLRMELEDDTVMEFSLQGDGLVDHEGDTLSWSTVPDNLGENDWDDEEDDWYYEEPAAGNGGFVGCWESVDSDDWLCLYSDSTYEWYSEDSLVSSSTYENYGDEICLDMGADMWFYMGTDGSIYDEEGSWEMYPSQLPDYLQ